MGYAFISYSSKDRSTADSIRKIFAKNNIDVWIAPDNIPGGSTYAESITTAIKSCSCCVLLLSKNSVASPWVPREVERAISYKKTVIPVYLENVKLTEELELYIGSKHMLYLGSLEEGSADMQGVLSAVKAHAESSDSPLSYTSPSTPNNTAQATPAEKGAGNYERVAKIIFVVLGFFAVLGLLVSLIGNDDKNNNNVPQFPSFGDLTSTVPSPSDTDSSANDSGTDAPVSGENQLSEEYERLVTALKYSSGLSLSNSTIRIKVGEYGTPPAAMVWEGIVIYSQNTGIAVGEGPVVKGVSKGETYVVLKSSTGATQAYRVIVE